MTAHDETAHDEPVHDERAERSLDAPLHVLDHSTPTHEEHRLLKELGPLVPVDADGVRAWLATTEEVARAVLDIRPPLSKHPDEWAALRDGEVPRDWALLPMLTAHSMINRDGAEHRRLRRIAAAGFTAKRVRAMEPRVTAITRRLLDELDPRSPVDLKERFCLPLPVIVVFELFGITGRDELEWFRERYTAQVDGRVGEAARVAASAQVREALGELVRRRRAEPADDLTSAMIEAGTSDGRCTDEELVGTLDLVLLAGHETTVHALSNTVHALLTHPVQLAAVLAGEHPWSHVAEVGVRWNGPVRELRARYAAQDVVVAGTRVRRGEPILVSLAGANRDGAPFDLALPQGTGHIGFGVGAHFCLGAALARQELEIALRELFGRFPRLRLAVPEARLRLLESAVINGLEELPVLLEPEG
ncbi:MULTISPECIES: cytochrome P450 [Actinosynnema]|uniref:cytochrome P450 family protein n=1 Tax=Actinosynnema TaxID=40566 RepID=UPI0020A3E0BC|nr:cytochrome P450 [Actinosynnema pretiosum]MCP2098522.1 Cytochrome P450 [Actinosynnema pretiosum]